MSEHVGLRRVRRVLDAGTKLAVIFLVAIFALTAGMLQPKEEAYYQPGIVSEYGLGTVLLLFFMLGAGIFGLLFLVSRFPKLYKYPVEMTAKNVEKQFLMAKIMFSLLQIICAVFFCAAMVGIFRATVPLGSNAFYLMTGVCVGASVIVLVVYRLVALANK